jgi:hypothetical protein
MVPIAEAFHQVRGGERKKEMKRGVEMPEEFR